MQVVGRIARVEQPLGDPERVGVATVRQRRQDRPGLGERDDVGGAERQRDLLGAGGRALGRRRVAADGRDHRDRRFGGGEPDRLVELVASRRASSAAGIAMSQSGRRTARIACVASRRGRAPRRPSARALSIAMAQNVRLS